MKKSTTFLTFALLSTAAYAHSGHADTSFFHGVAHPLSGADHLLAMFAVGLWAASFAGKTRWAIPACFVVAMAAGFTLGMNGVALPMLEAGIAASVMVLGLVAAWTKRMPTGMAAALVALFALFHGVAHGAEMHGSSALAYAAGFVLSTAMLHGTGLLAGSALRKKVWLMRAVGSLIGLLGLGMLMA